MESLQGLLYGITMIFALLTTLLGIFLLNTLFKNKLEELFTDKNFFVFFFLIAGYALFAAGELGWYLIYRVFGDPPVGSMPDVYWVMGQVFLFLSFLALSIQLYRTYGGYQKLTLVLITGIILIAGIIFIVSTQTTSGFLAYFYPLASVLIVLASLQVPLFLHQIPHWGMPLFLLFLTNVGFLVGDLLYISSTAQGVYGTLGVLSDGVYILAYLLSAYAFLAMLWKAHTHETVAQ